MSPTKRNVFLIGPMGSGKTSIGKHLAKLLELDFYDCDHELENQTGASINLIFDVEGEAGFRERESRMLEQLTEKSGILLSTGGGTVCRQYNRQLLQSRGYVIYLKTSVGNQIKRLSHDKSRPLLQAEDRVQRLNDLAQARNPLYDSIADLVYNTRNQGLNITAGELHTAISQEFDRTEHSEPMHTVEINLAERSYPVIIDSGILGQAHASLAINSDAVVLVISNETVAPLYLSALQRSLTGADIHTLILPDGEQFKNQQSWSQIIDKLIEIGATRDATIVTLGGGVIGDMGGFAAASYMRGINFIQIPTSLLAQVDASVGGKTGFNHAGGKNLIGAFHQPVAVVIDIDTLTTLPAREFSAGLAEVVKIAAVRDAGFLEWLENNTALIMNRDAGALSDLIKFSVTNKAQVVAEDEREAGIRALLNFGHSFAHALETITRYQRYLHGEAVAIGMLVAARLSEQRSLCDQGISVRLGDLLNAFGLPLNMPDDVSSDDMLTLMKLDKKVIAGRYRLILLKAVGTGIIDSNSSNDEIALAINASRTNGLRQNN